MARLATPLRSLGRGFRLNVGQLGVVLSKLLMSALRRHRQRPLRSRAFLKLPPANVIDLLGCEFPGHPPGMPDFNGILVTSGFQNESRLSRAFDRCFRQA